LIIVGGVADMDRQDNQFFAKEIPLVVVEHMATLH